MKILDCTLRDGGYYTNWDFEKALVQRYLTAVASANIDMVELGLRNFASSDYKGAFHFTTDDFLNSIDLPYGPEYGVMVDAKTILQSPKSIEKTVDELFSDSSKSKVSFVRVACHFDEVAKAENIAASLKRKNYSVFINLMQVSQRTDEELGLVASLVNGWKTVDGFYFADSLGNMKSRDILRVVKSLKTIWSGSIGIHAHNNMGQALANTLLANENGVEYLDATITGMGRGAGNTETELLIAELEDDQKHKYKYKCAPLGGSVFVDFLELKAQYKWGPSLHYYLAAKHNIHPTYIQEILTDSHFSLEDRVGSLNHLKKLKNRTEYKKSILRSLLVKPTPNLRNEFNSFADLKSISVKRSEAALLIGGGSSVETHRAAILQLLKRNQLCTFAVNQQAEAFSPHVDFKIVLPNAKQFSRKFEAELSSFSVVAPFDSFDHDEISKLGQSRLINFPMTLQNETFQFSSNGCTIPSPLSLGYGIAVISALKFKKVFLVGVDGYSHGDSRQKEMCDLFMLISKNLPDLELIALTDTTYPVRQSSIYAPVV